MDEKARESAFMTALVTEHFVLQSAASTTVSEAGVRASLYVFSLSSTLVALGFTAQSKVVFAAIHYQHRRYSAEADASRRAAATLNS